MELIYRELTSVYKQSEIDWKIIHNAGCTRDDTDLPDHVTAPNDLNRLISVTFRSFLTALPTPPTIVTIARYERIVQSYTSNFYILNYNENSCLFLLQSYYVFNNVKIQMSCFKRINNTLLKTPTTTKLLATL